MKILPLAGVAALAVIVILVVLSVISPSESDKNQVRVVFFANISHAAPIVGIENGYFADQLGDTQIKTRIVDSGPEAIEALFANSADLAYAGPAPFVNGYVKSGGQGIKILSGAAFNGASFVVQPDSGIVQPSDLAGKKIAAPFVGNTQDVSLRNYLTQNGLQSAEKGGNVIIYNIANAEINTIFAKKEIDAAWVPEPTATMLVDNLGGKRLFQEQDLWPDKKFPSVVLIGRADYIQKHPDIVQKWLVANQQAINWINQNPDQTESIYIKFYKAHTGKTLKPNIVHDSFSNIVYSSDIDAKSIKTFAERAYSLGYLGRNGYNLDDIYAKTVEASQWQN
ncbi:MAG: ABC transporter substrate-binding protein [Thaumarchaeota archaeon]|nr:ABC transporter substrate-binding protein [Nitrososphaerota archaeon]